MLGTLKYVSDVVDRALALWNGDTAAQDDALARFGDVYANPVRSTVP